MKELYTYPQETWDAEKCLKASKAKDHRSAYPGMIASSSSMSPEYGKTIRYNGGTIIEDEHYESAHRPLPVIASGFRIINRPTWGTYIIKEQTCTRTS